MHGIHLGDPHDYEYIVGLVLNMDDDFSRDCLAHAVGAAVAHGTGHVPASLLEGVCDSPEEAAALAFDINVKRDKKKFAALAKGGPLAILRAAR